MYSIDHEVNVAKSHALFGQYCQKVKDELGEDAADWEFGGADGDAYADVEDFICFVRLRDVAPTEPAKLLDYAVHVDSLLSTVFKDPDFSVAFEIHRARQHEKFEAFENQIKEDDPSFKFGMCSPLDDLDGFMIFLAEDAKAYAQAEGGEEEDLFAADPHVAPEAGLMLSCSNLQG